MSTKVQHFNLSPDTFDGTRYRGTTYIEMGTDTPVVVLGWAWNTALLDDGTWAERRNLYRPPWLVRAEQALADAQDEAETLSDARYGGCP
jgi:hypothetical protein